MVNLDRTELYVRCTLSQHEKISNCGYDSGSGDSFRNLVPQRRFLTATIHCGFSGPVGQELSNVAAFFQSKVAPMLKLINDC